MNAQHWKKEFLRRLGLHKKLPHAHWGFLNLCVGDLTEGYRLGPGVHPRGGRLKQAFADLIIQNLPSGKVSVVVAGNHSYATQLLALAQRPVSLISVRTLD